MQLGDFLTTINLTKQNLMAQNPDAVKAYPAFVAARCLSYHRDCIGLVNLLNEANVQDPKMHYEFLLEVVPKAKRFAKWGKPEKLKNVEFIARHFDCTVNEAESYLPLLSEEQIDQIVKKYDTTGLVSKEKK